MTTGISVQPAMLLFTKGSGFEVNVTKGEASTTQKVTITNIGTDNLSIQRLSLGGSGRSNFSLVSPPNLPLSLAPLAHQDLTVRFAPVALSQAYGLSAKLAIDSDDPLIPQNEVILTGDAVPVELSDFMAE